MDKKSSIRIPISSASNLKSKIENLKWLGLSVIAFVLVVYWGCGPGAAAEESPSDRVFIDVPIQLVSPPVPRQFGWLCASLAT